MNHTLDFSDIMDHVLQGNIEKESLFERLSKNYSNKTLMNCVTYTDEKKLEDIHSMNIISIEVALKELLKNNEIPSSTIIFDSMCIGVPLIANVESIPVTLNDFAKNMIINSIIFPTRRSYVTTRRLFFN
jgi:hypothetical protein